MLFAALEKAVAWEHLHDPQLVARMDAEGFLKLATEVYGKEEAERQTAVLAWERMRRDQEV